MNIDEARLYLEHTSKDDFNLEEWQKENRYQAIQVVLKEIERLKANYERIYNENCKLRENHNINDITLLDENERLNNIIKDIKSQLDYLETYSSKEDVFEDMKRRLDRIDKIISNIRT